MTNIHIMVGRLGRDPEIRFKNDGEPIATLSVATSKSWRDKDTGEWKERTAWHRVVVFNSIKAKYIQDNIHKGDLVSIVGEPETRSYEHDGEKKYIKETIIGRFDGDIKKLMPSQGSSVPNEGDYGTTRSVPSRQATETGPSGWEPPAVDTECDIPF